jgi:ferredoxin
MLVEKGYPREQLVVIGIPCTGQIDPEKMLPMLGKNGIPEDDLGHITHDELDIIDDNDKFKIKVTRENDKELELEIPKIEIIFDKCLECKYPNPIFQDILVTGQTIPRAKLNEGYERVSELDSMTSSEKWAFWAEKFDRCIRCYACRNICPVCYCKECLTDKWEPDWIQKSVNLTENTMFHVMRALHLAGRCISCHECERSCPVGIPLLDLYKKLEREVIDRFNYEPGTDLEAKPALSTFNPDDPGEFIL